MIIWKSQKSHTACFKTVRSTAYCSSLVCDVSWLSTDFFPSIGSPSPPCVPDPPPAWLCKTWFIFMLFLPTLALVSGGWGRGLIRDAMWKTCPWHGILVYVSCTSTEYMFSLMYSCFLWFLVLLIFLEAQYNLLPQLSRRQGSVHPWMVIITYYQITIQFSTQNDCWLHMDGFCFSCELGLSVTLTTIKFKVHTPPMSQRWENQKYSTYQASLFLFLLYHTCTPPSLRGILPLFVLQRFSWVWFYRSLGQGKKSPNPLFLSGHQAIVGGGVAWVTHWV